MPSPASDRPVAEISTSVPATPAQLAEVHIALQKFWVEFERVHGAPPVAGRRAQVETAVGELASNIVRHAYGTSAALGGEMTLTLCGYEDRVEGTLLDAGAAYTGPPLAELTMPDALELPELPEGGWGLRLTRAAVDELSYTRASGTNCWRFVRRL
jgi:anti-sigma regulatory factor (Ser/Thr protein kinase)